MRLARTDKIGEAGQVAATLFFNDLGWGPLETGKHDLGTDLFVQVRSGDHTDIGVMLGVQVKTGDSFFLRRITYLGRAGWWFRESNQAHLSYWRDHHIPHILIMQDESRQRQFWARLDRDSIVKTAKGLKVFVPEEQRLVPEVARVLTEIATDAWKRESFEGARWSFDLTQVHESEWPRYALLASRIVAPHPNQGAPASLNWAEALALCVQADLHRWDRLARESPTVPSPMEAKDLRDPGWKFAAAVYRWLTGSTQELEALEMDEMPSPMRVAVAICLSRIYTDRGDWRAAEVLLRRLRDPAERSVDQAWLAVHLSWVLYETGDFEAARTEVENSVELHAAFPSSLTNSAVRSAGVLALFDMAPLMTGDIAAAVQASDTTLAWWQTQQIEVALNDFVRRSFRRWGNEKSVTIGGSDTTHNDLLSAGLSASLVGDRRASRYSAFLRAIANLSLPNGSHARADTQLEVLRANGYAKELALALRHFRNEGPLSVVDSYMSDVTVSRATTTTIRADLQSLETAGSYLPANVARGWILYLKKALDDPSKFAHRFHIESDVRHEILKSLNGLRLHFTHEDEGHLASFALALPEDTSQLLESPLARILGSLSESTLRPRAGLIHDRGQSFEAGAWLGRLLIETASTYSEQARDAVRKQILGGSLGAIPGGFSIDLLTEDEAVAVVASCRREFDQFRGRHTGRTFGGPDPYEVASLIAIHGPSLMRRETWQILVDALLEDDVIQDRKGRAAELLARFSAQIPQHLREPLRKGANTLRNVRPEEPPTLWSAGVSPVGPAFSRLYLELEEDGEVWQEVLSELLAGDSHDRCAAIEALARRSGHEMVLLTLSRESDSEVALVAMSGLAKRAAEDSVVAKLALDHLLGLVSSGGEQAALHIGGGVLAATKRVPAISRLVESLRSHVSLEIRSLAHELE